MPNLMLDPFNTKTQAFKHPNRKENSSEIKHKVQARKSKPDASSF